MPGGGRARGSGACYHLSFRSGSRAGGSCASAAHHYITPSQEYDDPDRDAAIYVESDYMPEWVEDDAREYWDAADLYERASLVLLQHPDCEKDGPLRCGSLTDTSPRRG